MKLLMTRVHPGRVLAGYVYSFAEGVPAGRFDVWQPSVCARTDELKYQSIAISAEGGFDRGMCKP